MDDHEGSPDVRQRMEDLRHALAPVDPDAPRIPLQVERFQPFDGNEIHPVMQLRVNDFNTPDQVPIAWDVLMMHNTRDLWLLTVLDFTDGISHPVTGSTYITAEEAWEAAYSAIGEPMPSR